MITEPVGIGHFQQLSICVPPLPQCDTIAIVPVKNEAQTLAATLKALAHQTDLHGKPLSPLGYEIIVLANNCTDRSAAIAREFCKRYPLLALHVVELTLPADRAYIGYVRKLLMDAAYCRLRRLGKPQGIIASTDGDTQVAATWIAATKQEMSGGVDAVGGRIITDRLSRHALSPQAKTCFLQEVGYRSLVAELEFYLDPDPYDPLPRHYQHYGASLAVTAQMYATAGGMPPVKTPEDEAFYQSLLRVNARFRHSPLVQVTTSARASGRSPVGLANQLRKWTEMGDATLTVEPPAATISRFRSRRKLRSMWQKLATGTERLDRLEIEPIATKLGVGTDWLLDELVRHPTFGGLFEKVTAQHQHHWLRRWQPIDVKTAISDLRYQIARLNDRTA